MTYIHFHWVNYEFYYGGGGCTIISGYDPVLDFKEMLAYWPKDNLLTS